MKVLPKGKRSVKVFVAGSLLVVLFCFSAFCLPGPYEVRNNRMNELSVWEQRNDWDTIIREHPEKEETDYVSLNYLNMALAQKAFWAIGCSVMTRKDRKAFWLLGTGLII